MKPNGKPQASGRTRAIAYALVVLMVTPVAASACGKNEREAEGDDSDGVRGASRGGEVAPAQVESLERIGVEIRDYAGKVHYLKVNIAVELAAPIPPETFKKIVPFGRDAAIEYLRSIPYDALVAPGGFEHAREVMGTRVAAALGKQRVRRVLFTDFAVE